jgi:drug/metabolite transporter (DMT)-like permease
VFSSESFAIASALCIALGSMFLSELKGRVPLFQMARWQMLAAFGMTALVSLALGGWRTVGPREFLLLSGSSIVGIAIASTTYFAAIYSVGPRVTALLFSLTAPFALALGYVVLGETITARQGFGVALVLAGVLLAVALPWRVSFRRERAPNSLSAAAVTAPVLAPPATLHWRGIAFGVVTALGQAGGSLFARPAMAAGVEPFTAMAIRSGLAALIFVALTVTPVGAKSRAPVRFDAMALALAAAFVGMGLGMTLLMEALHTGDVGVVSTLSSVTPVLVLPMVWIRSGVRPSAPAWAGALPAIAGIALISLR